MESKGEGEGGVGRETTLALMWAFFAQRDLTMVIPLMKGRR